MVGVGRGWRGQGGREGTIEGQGLYAERGHGAGMLAWVSVPPCCRSVGRQTTERI